MTVHIFWFKVDYICISCPNNLSNFILFAEVIYFFYLLITVFFLFVFCRTMYACLINSLIHPTYICIVRICGSSNCTLLFFLCFKFFSWLYILLVFVFRHFYPGVYQMFSLCGDQSESHVYRRALVWRHGLSGANMANIRCVKVSSEKINPCIRIPAACRICVIYSKRMTS